VICRDAFCRRARAWICAYMDTCMSRFVHMHGHAALACGACSRTSCTMEMQSGGATVRGVMCWRAGFSRTRSLQVLRDFEERDGPLVLLVSTRAGGVGLSLTAASRVYMMDLWWNAAVDQQVREG